MANAYKILAQAAPATTAATEFYTAPSATEAVISSIVVCNLSTAAQTFRVAVSTSTGAVVSQNYLYYDTPLPVNDTFVASIAMTMAASDQMTVQTGSTGPVVAYSLFGAEIT